MTKKEQKQAEILRAYDALQQYKGCRVLANIYSVSKSGMSRRINFYVIKDNREQWVTPFIAKIVGLSFNDNGLSVGGCGMDMVFSVLSDLNYKMADLYADEIGIPRSAYWDQLKKEGSRIYDNYFIDANNYGRV